MPGTDVVREYAPEKYSPYQEAMWQAINSAYYAWLEGRGDFYRPTPGLGINPEKFKTWKQKAIDAWAVESKSRGKGVTRGLILEDLPENLWLWLYERLVKAKKYKATDGIGVSRFFI